MKPLRSVLRNIHVSLCNDWFLGSIRVTRGNVIQRNGNPARSYYTLRGHIYTGIDESYELTWRASWPLKATLVDARIDRASHAHRPQEQQDNVNGPRAHCSTMFQADPEMRHVAGSVTVT